MTIVNKKFRNGCLLAWMVLNAFFCVWTSRPTVLLSTTVTARSIWRQISWLRFRRKRVQPKVKEVNLQLINGELVLQYEPILPAMKTIAMRPSTCRSTGNHYPSKTMTYLATPEPSSGKTWRTRRLSWRTCSKIFGSEGRFNADHQCEIFRYPDLTLRCDLWWSTTWIYSETKVAPLPGSGSQCRHDRRSPDLQGFQQSDLFEVWALSKRPSGRMAPGRLLTCFIMDAQSDHKIYWSCNGGGAILAANVTWFVVRAVRNKRQEKEYDEYCAPAKVGFQPYIGRPESLTGTETDSV